MKSNWPSSPNRVRAALLSPGSVLAPLDSEGRSDYMQQRLAVLAKIYLSMAVFFLIAGNIHRAIFRDDWQLLKVLTEGGTQLQGCVMLIQFGVLAVLKRQLRSPLALAFIDAGLVFSTLGAIAVQLWLMRGWLTHPVDQMLMLASVFVLMERAVMIPSPARATFAVTVVGLVPSIMVAARYGAERHLFGQSLSACIIWCIVTVALSTFTSSVIYGLRETAALAQQVGQYVLERKIGEGGMGEVYLARHTMLRRPTAIKLLPPERAGDKTIARFEREVRQTSHLSHPNTVAIYDYGRTREGVFYYAMEYLDGLDLQRVIDDSGPMPPSRVVHVLAQIAGALAEAHGRGLVHRDMKPANVILCDRGGLRDTVKVLDFGLVKDTSRNSTDAPQTEVNALIGTPSYMSPEAILSPEGVSALSDLYAVGAIGYFLLTGEEVFVGKSTVAICVAHLNETPVWPSERSGRHLPADLEELVLRCLEKAPEARPASAAELRSALLACNVPAWTDQDANSWWASRNTEPVLAERKREAEPSKSVGHS